MPCLDLAAKHPTVTIQSQQWIDFATPTPETTIHLPT